jgi:hypothetical protein
MILVVVTLVALSACSSSGSKPTATSPSVSALEAYFAQYCSSARTEVAAQRAISTPLPGDADDARRFADASDQVLAEWLQQEEQVVPPEAAATAHAELLTAIRDVATAGAEDDANLLDKSAGAGDSPSATQTRRTSDAAVRSGAAREALFRIAADAKISTAQCLG